MKAGSNSTPSYFVNEQEPRVPAISIGLPVYNGEKYLNSALDALLKQSIDNFELIISDNGSTDSTEEICRQYSARDNRIRYYRSPTNRGAAWNFNYVFELARGKYFMWAAHDDLWAPSYLEQCFKQLENNPDNVLCYAATRIIDEHDQPQREFHSNPGLSANKPHERFAAAWRYQPQIPVFGLIRSETLRKTRLIGNYSSSDRVLVGELAMLGPFFGIDTFLFYYRRHQQQSSGTNFATRRARRAWFDPNKTTGISFPMLNLGVEYAKSILRVPLTLNERFLCFASLGRWIIRHRKQLLR